MTKYSLITVYEQEGDKIKGFWVQDVTGTFEEAVERAKRTEAVNRDSDIAVVEQVFSTTPWMHNYRGLTRLDTPRANPKYIK